MSSHINRDPLFTRVKNTSGANRVFGYLGTHGLRLAANEEYTLRGNLLTKLGNQIPARQFQALERDLQRGVLEIVQTPPPLLYDPVLDHSRVLTLVNNVLGVIAPEWETSSLSSFDG